MSEKDEQQENQNNEELNLDSEETTISLSSDGSSKTNQPQKIETLPDGTQTLKSQDVDDEVVEEKEEIDPEDLRKLLHFTLGRKDVSDSEIEGLKENEDELARLYRIFMYKAERFTYRPKKKFGKKYRKMRKKKNRMTKASRLANRKHNNQIKYVQ